MSQLKGRGDEWKRVTINNDVTYTLIVDTGPGDLNGLCFWRGTGRRREVDGAVVGLMRK